MRATCTRTEGVRHVFAAYELGEDKLFGHVKPRKTRARFLEFCRYLRTLYPLSTGSRSSVTTVRIMVVPPQAGPDPCDNWRDALVKTCRS